MKPNKDGKILQVEDIVHDVILDRKEGMSYNDCYHKYHNQWGVSHKKTLIALSIASSETRQRDNKERFDNMGGVEFFTNLKQRGYSSIQIAKYFDVDHSVIGRYLQRYGVCFRDLPKAKLTDEVVEECIVEKE